MYDPSMRVLTVLELLQARPEVSASELAARLEVSVRTVQRYIARLQDLGVPVTSARGPGATYRLRPGFRLPPMMLGTEEAFAVAIGLDALSYIGLDNIAPASAALQAKLERVLPEAISRRVRTVRDALLLERPRGIANVDVTVLFTLAAAIQANHRVQLRYQARATDFTSRVVEPYGLMQHEGRWFLAAYCQLRQDRRLFRVDRVHSATSLTEPFEHPTDFDLRAFVYDRIAFAPAPWDIEVWLEMPLQEVESRLPRALALLEAEGSGTRVKRGGTDLEWFAALLLQLGCAVEVRQPPELRAAFQSVAARALQIARTP
jgi:predicted DNA-binding transcriptional regulator YafY